jgi:enamine deaminase RidA (YjgF/YER057c/UK114 family)
MPFAPAPCAVRAGDYVFTSSIYPVDNAGHAVMTDERLGEAGPSLIAAQTRHCFEALKTILEEHGSSLDRMLKAEVHLVDAADFYEFKLVWREYFPNDPPARTAVEVGDTLPFRGARLNLDVVALAGDSKLERQALRDPEGPDPRSAEAASWAVRAGNLVLCSGFAASNFTTGLAAGKSRVPDTATTLCRRLSIFSTRSTACSRRPTPPLSRRSKPICTGGPREFL